MNLDVIKLIILAIYTTLASVVLIGMLISAILSDIQFKKDRKKLLEEKELIKKKLEENQLAQYTLQDQLAQYIEVHKSTKRKFKIEK